MKKTHAGAIMDQDLCEASERIWEASETHWRIEGPKVLDFRKHEHHMTKCDNIVIAIEITVIVM
jgi:hypothetical protein